MQPRRGWTSEGPLTSIDVESIHSSEFLLKMAQNTQGRNPSIDAAELQSVLIRDPVNELDDLLQLGVVYTGVIGIRQKVRAAVLFKIGRAHV